MKRFKKKKQQKRILKKIKTAKLKAVKKMGELKLKPTGFYRIECASQYHMHGQHYASEQDAFDDAKIVGCRDARVVEDKQLT